MKKRFICGMAAAVLALSGGGAAVGNVADFGLDIAASAVNYKENDDYQYYIDSSGVVISDYMGDATDVYVPSEIEGLPVVKIGDNAFYRKDIDKVVIPDSVKTIGNYAFQGSLTLKTVVLPDSLGEIQSYAFAECTSLKTIVLPSSLKTISDRTFRASGLESIVIPSNVTTIGYEAFYDCGMLSNVTLNEGLITINSFAFSKCSALKTLRVPKSVKTFDSHAIGYTTNSFYTYGIYNDFTLLCYRNSNARLYAVDNNINYEIITATTKVNPAVTATVGTTTTDLKWEAVSGAQKYAICGYVNGEWKQLAETANTSYTLKGLAGGTAYKVAVIAMFDNAWYEDYSKAVSFTTNAAPVTAAYPEIVNIVRNKQYHQFKIEWEPVKGAQKYGVAVLLSGKWKVINQDIPASTTTFTSPKLKEGSTYKIVVCAKVNGVWDTNKIERRATSITVV